MVAAGAAPGGVADVPEPGCLQLAERLLSPLEWLALIAAIGNGIWCMAKPLGGPKYGLKTPNSRRPTPMRCFCGSYPACCWSGTPHSILQAGQRIPGPPDGSVSVRRGDSWEPLMEYQYSTVTADGTTIDFTPPADGPPAVVLPQDRVFSREYGVRLPGKVSAEFFRRLLAAAASTSSRRRRAATASRAK